MRSHGAVTLLQRSGLGSYFALRAASWSCSPLPAETTPAAPGSLTWGFPCPFNSFATPSWTPRQEGQAVVSGHGIKMLCNTKWLFSPPKKKNPNSFKHPSFISARHYPWNLPVVRVYLGLFTVLFFLWISSWWVLLTTQDWTCSFVFWVWNINHVFMIFL